MYGNYNDDYEENEMQNKSFLDKLVSYLPSTKILGIIVLVEIIIFAIVLFIKNKNDSLVISLENNPEYLLVNDTKKINFKVDGESYNGNYNDVNIKVDKSMLASVNNGMITAGSIPGSTNILVIYTKNGNSFMGSGRLIVYMGDRNTLATDIDVPSSSLTIKLGSTFDLASNISITPSNGYIEKIEYYNADTKVIKIDDAGKIEGLSLGESNVTIVVNDKLRKNLNVIVTDSDENLGFGDGSNAGEVDTITFNQPEITITNNIAELKMKKGDLFNLVPVITPSNATNKALTFEALDKTILQVTPNIDNTMATITALKSGTTTLTVKSTNGKMGVLNVVISGSSGTTSSKYCYCNSSHKCIWGSKTSDYTERQSQLPNSTSCSIYSNNSGQACFKDSKGDYHWGRYGNSSGYTYVAGISSMSTCKNNSTTTDSLTCPSIYKGESGQCTLTTSTSSQIKGATSSDGNIIKINDTGKTTIKFTCVDNNSNSNSSATITAQLSNGNSVSKIVPCRTKNNISLSCTPINPGKGDTVTCKVSGLTNSSELKSCSSDKGSFKKEGTSCVGTYNGEGKVKVSAETTLGKPVSKEVVFQKGSKVISVSCPSSKKIGEKASCTVSGATNIKCSAPSSSCSCSSSSCTVSYNGTETKEITVTFTADDAPNATRRINFIKDSVVDFKYSCSTFVTGKSTSCSVTTTANWSCSTNTANARCYQNGNKCNCSVTTDNKNYDVKVVFKATSSITSSGANTITKNITFNYVGNQPMPNN